MSKATRRAAVPARDVEQHAGIEAAVAQRHLLGRGQRAAGRRHEQRAFRAHHAGLHDARRPRAVPTRRRGRCSPAPAAGSGSAPCLASARERLRIRPRRSRSWRRCAARRPESTCFAPDSRPPPPYRPATRRARRRPRRRARAIRIVIGNSVVLIGAFTVVMRRYAGMKQRDDGGAHARLRRGRASSGSGSPRRGRTMGTATPRAHSRRTGRSRRSHRAPWRPDPTRSGSEPALTDSVGQPDRRMHEWSPEHVSSSTPYLTRTSALPLRAAACAPRLDPPLPLELALAFGDDHLEAGEVGGERLIERRAHFVTS